MKLADIPTETFNRIVDELRSEGWRKVKEYDGFNAWIDYGLIVLERQGVTLKCEWDNWMEGSVEGPDEIVQTIRARFGLG